jgi:hypothetical protein
MLENLLLKLEYHLLTMEQQGCVNVWRDGGKR